MSITTKVENKLLAVSDKLIITTEQRDYFLRCIKTLCIGSHSDVTRTAQTLQELLQSLPMVSAEHVDFDCASESISASLEKLFK